MTEFVGRRKEVAEVKRLLQESRMVTLTGPGGVGKTRLALRVAAEVRRAFPDGVWLVPLADLSSPELIAETVAATLGVQDRARHGPMDTLADFLGRRHLLLVLDNCEHLVEAGAAFLQELLPWAPDLHVLATSRQSLGIAGECAWPVPPLPVPPLAGDDPERREQETATRLRPSVHSEAVDLFARRGAAVSPGFALTPGNAAAVLEICRRLDGIPLALELAAARLRSLSPQQILARLDDRFELLVSGNRVGAPRQRSLRAVIDWSYEYCTEAERLLWQRASVFSGGFDLDAAEQVCAGDGIPDQDVLHLVDALVDKSILITGIVDGQARYRMLDTIRRHGLDNLTRSGQRTTVQHRHRDHFRSLARTAQQCWFGPDQVTWFARLRREYANLRAAMEFSLAEPGEAHAALAICADLFPFSSVLPLSEARHWHDRGLALVSEPVPARSRALWVNAWIAGFQGDFPAARKMTLECRTLAHRLDDQPAITKADHLRGVLALHDGDLEAAIPLLEESLVRHLAVGDLQWITCCRRYLSQAVSMTGDVERAVELCESAVAASETHGEVWSRAWSLVASRAVPQRGDRRRVELALQEGLRIMTELGDRFGIAHCLELAAWTAADDRPDRAARLFGAARTVLRDTGASVVLYLGDRRDRYMNAVRAELGEKAFTALFDQGALTVEEAVAEVLAGDGPGAAAPAADGESRDGPCPLTPREQEAAELVAEGLTNKEIAARMVISRRTAEVHIANIMTKLGFTSRSQIAAMIARRPQRVR